MDHKILYILSLLEEDKANEIKYFESKIKKCQHDIADLESKINKHQCKIDKIKTSDIDYSNKNNECALTSKEDRIKILGNMLVDFGFRLTKKYMSEGLFFHVDNIRYAYEQNKCPCPEWFVEKYGKLFCEPYCVY